MHHESTNTGASESSRRGKKNKPDNKLLPGDKTPGQPVSEPLSPEEIKARKEEAARDEGKKTRLAGVTAPSSESVVTPDSATEESREEQEMVDLAMKTGRDGFIHEVTSFIELHEPAARKAGNKIIADDLAAIKMMLKQFAKHTQGSKYWVKS